MTSPENTGILIDDVTIAPMQPMSITSAEVVPFTLPALKGAKRSALVKLKIKVNGTKNPISINEIEVAIPDQTSKLTMGDLQVFAGGNISTFQCDKPFGTPASLDATEDSHVFTDKLELTEGDNFIWLAGNVEESADIDHTISARIESITFSNGEKIRLDAKPAPQRLGIALRSGGDEGVHTYRIPGLVTSNQGTLIGVYDIRYDGSRDLPGNIDVGMSRSTDGGRTWEPMKVIIDMGDDPKWRWDGVGDPSILVDRTTGTIWVSAIWSHGNRSWFGSGPGLTPDETGQWILVKSEDDGVTWSDPLKHYEADQGPKLVLFVPRPGKRNNDVGWYDHLPGSISGSRQQR